MLNPDFYPLYFLKSHPNKSSAASGSLFIAKSAELILPFIRRAGGNPPPALALAFFQLLVDKRLCLL